VDNPRKEKAVTAALIIDDGKYLLARRVTADHGSGGWEFPGGKVEPGETPAACLVREIREELGLVVETTVAAGELRYEYGTGAILLMVFHVRIIGGELKPAAHEEIAWVAPVDLLSYDLLPADREFVVQHLAPHD
jgi:8-oxo-dGTP diphosphatase